MTTPRIPLWLDCDPGHDDMFAILLAAYHPGIRLLGVSTVFGNASLDKTTRNASSILTAIGKHKDIPIYPGAHKAMLRPSIHAPTDIHGESGLDGTRLLPPGLAKVHTLHAVDGMADALSREAPGTAWVVATGSTTNVGLLFQRYPELATHIKGLSIMGGAVGGGFSDAVMGKVDGVERTGNWTQFAEFNIFVDPEAADSIFRNPVLASKTTLIPLDLTHQVLATQEVQDLLLYGKGGVPGGPGKTTLRIMLVELLMFFAMTYKDVFGIEEGPPLHDPLAVAVALMGAEYEIPFYDWDVRRKSERGEAAKERFVVSIVTEGTSEDARTKGLETGRTVVTLLEDNVPGVRIPRGVDVQKFWQVIEECIERADAVIAGEVKVS